MNPASFEVFITQLSFKKNNEYTSVKVFLKDQQLSKFKSGCNFLDNEKKVESCGESIGREKKSANTCRTRVQYFSHLMRRI